MWRSALIGGVFVLLGVAIVEITLAAGGRPLTPIGWPTVGACAAATFFGWRGLWAAVPLMLLYHAGTAVLAPERFPQFFAGPGLSMIWLPVVALLVAVIAALRERLVRAMQAELREQAMKEGEHALRESEQRLRLVADNLPALVGYVDQRERLLFTNRAYEDWFGLRGTTGRTVREVWGAERYESIRDNVAKALRGERVTYEYKFADKHGRERHVLAEYVPDTDARGSVRGFFVLGTDVSTLDAARQELQRVNDRLEQALEGSSVALWDTDLQSGRVYLSEAWARMLGRPPGETVTTTAALSAEAHPEDLHAIRRASLEALKGQKTDYSVEHRVRAAGGEWRWILSRGRVTERDPQSGRALRMVGTNIDITERKRAEQTLHAAAQTDPLTGVGNRTLLIDRARLAMARMRRTGARCALVYLDLDRFKEVNDRHGHAAGDAVLREFAARLRECVRETDTVARLGGDEFVVLLEGIKDVADAERIAGKILERARQPVRATEREIALSASIGLAHAGGDADEQAWLARADAALYAAKNAGRDSIRIAR